GDSGRLIFQQHTKIEQNDDCNEQPEQNQEFSLRDQIGFAGLINELRDLAHGTMHRQILQPRVDHQTESQAENAKQHADHQQRVAINATKKNAGEIGQLQIGFTADAFRLRHSSDAQTQKRNQD